MIDLEKLKTEKLLGCGCSTFGGSISERNALKTLNYCFDEGIIYFDVARSYGYGQAESILSKFLFGKRDELLVSSKFGIDPPPSFLFKGLFTNVLRSIKNRIPNSKKLMRKLSDQVLGKKIFTPQMVVNSLNKSLSELRTSYLDIFIYHESSYSEILNDDIKNLLNKETEKGKIRIWGVNAHSFIDQEKIINNNVATPVLQLPFSLSETYDNLTSRENQINIIYSILSPLKKTGLHSNYTLIEEISSKYPELECLHSELEMLLYLACQQLRNGIILFAATNSMHIKRNIQIFNYPQVKLSVGEYLKSFFLNHNY